MTDFMRGELGAPKVVDRSTFHAELDALLVREKAHTREGDAIAAARRRLPMVEVDGATPLIGERGPVTLLDVFEGRRMLIAYYFMWHTDHPAPEQCEGCTFFTSQVRELSNIHARDVTYATVCQGPYEESARYRDFMGWEMPWYSAAQDSLETLGRTPGGHDAHRLLPAPRIQCLRDLLDVDARRRGDGQQLPAARPDRLRAAGDVGGLAHRLATTVGRQAAYAYRWTSHLPVVSPEGRVFGRPGNRQALTSFLHHSDWHLRALTCSLPRRNSRANAMR